MFIAIGVPICSYVRRHSPKKRTALSNIHMFGNLGAFLLISLHFSQQVSRPAESFPDLGTGLTLFIAVSILVVTGILQVFKTTSNLFGYQRMLHVGAAMTFYIVIVIHILHGLGVI